MFKVKALCNFENLVKDQIYFPKNEWKIHGEDMLQIEENVYPTKMFEILDIED